MKYILLLHSLAAVVYVVLSVPNRPPSIYLQAPYDVYYKVSETVQMQCEADAVPNPKYNWTRNQRPFDTSGNDNRMVKLQHSGTIVMNKPQNKDEGIFQCLAYNDLGVSTSININFRQAMLEDFPYGKDRTITVVRGHSIKLYCTPPTSIPKAEIKWVLRDYKSSRIEAINLNNRITQDLEGRLYITNVKSEDYQNGRSYVCMATNYFMRKNTYSYGTVIYPVGSSGTDDNVSPHYLWSTPKEIFGILGEPMRIKCIFGGNPTPEVHWENKTGNIPDNRRTLSLGGQELLISSLQRRDSGSYTCYTSSALGKRQQRNINIILKAKPYWLDGGEPQDIETSVGAKATFICRAGGDPRPRIEWYINGVKFKDARHVTLTEGRLLKPNDNELTVIDLRLGDAMVLQCNASNTYGYVFADFYLNVLKEKPQFIKRPVKELKVAENTNVNLTCQTSGKPDPIITWYKERQQITGGRYQILPNGDLYITNIVLSDAGNFTCTAQNDQGSTTDWGVMIVRRKTRIEQRPTDLEVFAKTDAKFTCSGTTDFEEVKNLRVKWLKDRKEISYTNQRMTTNVQDNSLTISGTISRDSGFYTCVVTNGLDEETASAILTVKDKPEPPEDVKTKDCLNRTVKVTWTKGGFNNAPIQYFTIQYNTSVEPDKWNFAATANQSANTIKLNLRPGVTYSFRLLATNKIGISEPSKHSDTCKTDTASPYKNPENVRGIGDTPSYLIIEWTPMPPIDQGGDNFRYIIKISKYGAQNLDEIRTITNWRQSRYEFLTNDVYTPYNVTVQARNEHQNNTAELKSHLLYSGESKPNPGVVVDGFVVDSAAMQDNAATFYWNWDMSKNNLLNGKFQGFKLQYWVQGMKRITFREDEIRGNSIKARYGAINKQSSTEFTYTVKNLLPYTYIEAQICVMNTYYVSAPSTVVAFVTSRGVPGPVIDLHPSVIGSNFVELTWTKPELLNSPAGMEMTNSYLLGYDVSFQEVKGLDLGKMQDMDPQISDPRLNKTVLNGLTANKKYRIHMWGKTENGRGEVSFIEVTTAKASGMKVPAFSIININSTFFNLTWTTIINKKYGTVAFVEYRIKGTSDWQQSPQEVSKSWIGINKLDKGTSFEVRLAVTNGGKTSKSDIEIVKTKGISMAISLGGNIGWFIGLLISVLILIIVSVLIVLRYKQQPEPQPQPRYKAPPRQKKAYHRDDVDVSTQDIVRKSSSSLNKGYDNYTYSDRDYHDNDGDVKDYNRGYRDDDDRYQDDYKNGYGDGKGRYDDGYDRRRSDEYDRNRYAEGDDDYDRKYGDDYDRRHDDSYDYDRKGYDYDDYDKRRDDYDDYDKKRDDYDRRRDDHDDYDRRRDDHDDYDRRHDDYDRRRDDYDYDRRSDDGYDRYGDDRRRYSDRSDRDQYSRRPDYDRTPSYDKRPPSIEDDEDLKEPSKFDKDGYPIETKPSTSKSSVSSIV